MKKFYPTIILLAAFSFCKAQSCIAICDSNLLNGPFPFSGSKVAGPINYGLPGGITNVNFHDVKYADDTGAGCNIGADDCTQDSSALIYKVFYPTGYTKQQFIDCPLPCVIVVHGGVFYECSSYTNISGWCKDFAKLGFVAINIEYRRGRIGNAPFVSVQDALALYRAAQDVRGAIRSIIYRQTQEGITVDDDYRIDTSRLFLAGESAGGLAVLCAAYYNQNMMNELLPAVAPGTTIVDALGSINAPWYDDGGNQPMSYYRKHIKGILIKSSGMYVPYSFRTDPRSFFEVTPYIPIIFFHGEKDPVFDIDSSNLRFSSNSPYNSTSYCINNTNGPFKVQGNPSFDLINYGSRRIYNFLLQNPLYPLTPSELYIDCQLEHNLDPDGTNPYLTEFGTGFTNHDDVTQYISVGLQSFLVIL
ncbi:alpha/beta hydrolase [Parafilimonas terrae]|uniref:Alpha/beta hydrolase fold n=1 Tax=Parafilimonas terrae TaxID=1465490 RepID=A0A1I5ZGW1_9BACT|nr:alpha/beta hydrolase [Parafilimonas terrae]SFQ55357.1 alpha/beta hydrolase fold [Parafilimonas terrae]